MNRKIFFFSIVLFLIQLYSSTLWARPMAADEAKMAVTGWLRVYAQPLGSALGQDIAGVETFTNEDGETIYYIVYLQPSGFVIVPADDLIEPIIGFADDGTYDPSPDNPLGALVTNDLNGRIAMVRDIQALEATSAMEAALESQTRWNQLTVFAEAPGGPATTSLPSVDDPRVDPLVQSNWAQTKCCTSPSLNCYNYYTPNNYPCGCVATAMAQLMRYHQHPVSPVLLCFLIEVDGEQQGYCIRGGDGSGGPYNWNDMVLVPNCSTTLAQRQAIGALCSDAGGSVQMSYTSGSSSANTLDAKDALIDTFKYGNAVKGYNSGSNIGAGLIGMVNPNLDCGFPALLGITGPSGGHAIVCDGYGYNSSTMYHHLNMGWSETANDAWYNLPNITTTNPNYTFTSVYKCVYNIYPYLPMSGNEIVSGRITTPEGDPINNAEVCFEYMGGPLWSLWTNERGIYAYYGFMWDETFWVSVLKEGYVFHSRDVTTGKSIDLNNVSGNRWGVDFVCLAPQITSIMPTHGPTGTDVTIKGQYFCDASYQGSVIFSIGAAAEILSWSNTEIICRVPDSAASGDVVVRTSIGIDSDGKYFDVTYLGDLDGDSDVDLADFAIFALAWRTTPGQPGWNPDCEISIPADNYIDILDLAAFVDNWLAGVE